MNLTVNAVNLALDGNAELHLAPTAFGDRITLGNTLALASEPNEQSKQWWAVSEHASFRISCRVLCRLPINYYFLCVLFYIKKELGHIH